MQKRLLICCSFDSFIKASYSIRDVFEAKNYFIQYFLLTDKGVVDKAHLEEIGFIGEYETGSLRFFFDSCYLSQFDAVMLSLKGPVIYRIMSQLADIYPENIARPVFFGGYCGIVYEKFSLGLLARQPLDIFYVNSKYDYKMFRGMLAEYRVPDSSNIKLTGLPLLDLSCQKSKPASSRKIKSLLFAGQPTVPESLAERTCIVYSLILYCQKYPDRKVYLKPRHKPNQDSVHKTLFHYQRILEKLSRKIAIPANLILTYESILSLLDRVDLCLTVSSTAAFEAVNKGVPVGFLMDFGIREDYGTTYFVGSGCAITFTDLLADVHIEPDKSWWKDRYLSDGKNSQRVFEAVDSLVDRVSEQGAPLPFHYNHLNKLGHFYEEFKKQDVMVGYRATLKNFLLKIYYFLKVKGIVE